MREDAKSFLNEFAHGKKTGRRRIPRRNFETSMGLLIRGQYEVARTFQISEGGAMVTSTVELKIGDQMVANFFITRYVSIIVRAIVRSVVPPKDKLPLRYGIEFLDLGFQFKREIRNYVAAATYAESITTD